MKVGSHIEDRFQIEGLDNIYSHIDELKNEVIFAGNHESVIDAFFKGLVLYKELRHKWINILVKRAVQ